MPQVAVAAPHTSAPVPASAAAGVSRSLAPGDVVASAATRVSAPPIPLPSPGRSETARDSFDAAAGRSDAAATRPQAESTIVPAISAPSPLAAAVSGQPGHSAVQDMRQPPAASDVAAAPCASPPPRSAASMGTSAGAQLPPPPPIKPVVLTFRDVSYSVSTKAGDKQLLRSVFGCACPGTVTALCGASGAGKTTLLDGASLVTQAGGLSCVHSLDPVPTQPVSASHECSARPSLFKSAATLVTCFAFLCSARVSQNNGQGARQHHAQRRRGNSHNE